MPRHLRRDLGGASPAQHHRPRATDPAPPALHRRRRCLDQRPERISWAPPSNQLSVLERISTAPGPRIRRPGARRGESQCAATGSNTGRETLAPARSATPPPAVEPPLRPFPRETGRHAAASTRPAVTAAGRG